jgi:hypothetical protein
MKIGTILLASALMLSASAWAQPPMDRGGQMPGMPAKPATAALEPDVRQKVDMPPEVVEVLRAEMRSMLVNLNQVVTLMAEGKRAEAAQAAADGLGMGHMMRHRGNIHPGMHMPPDMRALAMGMHRAGEALGYQLKSAEPQKDLAALQSFVGFCAACHSAYRVR